MFQKINVMVSAIFAAAATRVCSSLLFVTLLKFAEVYYCIADGRDTTTKH